MSPGKASRPGGRRSSLAARRPPQQQRNLAVGVGMLGQVIIDDQGMAAVVAYFLADGAARVGRDVLHRRRVGGRGRHDAGILHRPMLLQHRPRPGHGGHLLADGHIDAVDALPLLVDDRVNSQRGLADLAVADDQFTLAAADGDQGVNGLERRIFQMPPCVAEDLALAVQRLAQGADHAPKQRLADPGLADASRRPHLVALADLAIGPQQDDADVVLLQVQDDAHDAAGKLHQFAGHRSAEAVDRKASCRDLQHRAHVDHLQGGLEGTELLL